MTEQATRAVRLPSPEHPITISHHAGQIQVMFNGKTIAESGRALTLAEAAYAPVQYVPLGDVDPAVLRKSDHTTYCPYKGECSYYDLIVDGKTVANAVWYYEHPFQAVEAIAGHVAFYPDRVDQITGA